MSFGSAVLKNDITGVDSAQHLAPTVNDFGRETETGKGRLPEAFAHGDGLHVALSSGGDIPNANNLPRRAVRTALACPIFGQRNGCVNAIARPLLIQRFHQPSIALQDQLWHLFEQARVVRSDASDAAVAAAHQACIEVWRIMVQSLTEEDWQALRQTAVAMLEQYLQHKQAEMNVGAAGIEHEAGAED